MIEWMDLGYVGLFLAAFLAATVLPLSSDALLVAMIAGTFEPTAVVLIATAGNTLGGMSSYLLGRLGRWTWIEKLLRTKRERILRWKAKINRQGSWLAFWCWVPIIGDPLAIALGLFRNPPIPVAAWMLVGKFSRYALLAWLTLEGKSWL